MKVFKNILLLFLFVPLMGCNSIYWKLPNKGSKQDYLYVFYGLHRQLTAGEKIEGKRLFNEYIITHELYMYDDIYGTNSNYSMLVIDNECNAEEKIWQFEEKIK